MKSYLAGAIQMTSTPNLATNLSSAADFVQQAVRQGAELVTLPENFAFLGEETEKVNQASAIAQQTEKFLKTTAQRYQITLVGGGFPIPVAEGKVSNTALMVNAEGEEVVRYDKIHLFDVNLPDGNRYQESKTVQAGTQPQLAHSPDFGTIGLSVCYDIRFPEMYRELAQQGAEILLIPSAFTAYTGQYHWQVLLQARAIENTCYVIAPAQTGHHYARRESHGHAMIIDPWGIVLSDAGDQPGLALAEITPSRLEQIRHQMPSLQHRVL